MAYRLAARLLVQLAVVVSQLPLTKPIQMSDQALVRAAVQ